ncbi:LacI family DNA-binding transcriptional regulator [Lachnospiraceae bacterium 42-17]|nr:LacI family transcriptional regulator [Dorea sp.]
MKKATLKDVSSKSGVSVSTVSRYINGSGYVDEKTARCIQEAVEELNYKPNKFAQSLKKDATQQIVLIVPDILNPYYAVIFRELQERALAEGYTIVLYDTAQREEEEIKAVSFAEELGADGIIYCSIYKSEECLKRLIQNGKPVIVNNNYKMAAFDTLYSEEGNGIYISARHLLECGHRKIGYVGGNPVSDVNIRRKRGFFKAVEEQDISVPEDWIFEMDFSMAAGYKAGMYFASLEERPTALCAANDIIAMGLITAFNERRIRIPQDISITGEDNIEFSKICRPTLTTVENSGSFFAENAYRLLMERIKKQYTGEARKIVCPRELIIRESTKIVREEKGE